MVKEFRANRGSSVIGWFPSLKLNRMVRFNSLIECDYLYLLDYWEHVLEFVEQPFAIEYWYEHKLHRYTPDFYVKMIDTTILTECKPERFVDTEENLRKFRAAVDWCKEREWQFVVATNDCLRTGHRLSNVKLMTSYARHSIDAKIKREILKELEHSQKAMSISELSACFAPEFSSTAFGAVMNMGYRHQIVVPIDDQPITLDTPVSLPGQ